MRSRHLEQGGRTGLIWMTWMQSSALGMQQSHQLQLTTVEHLDNAPAEPEEETKDQSLESSSPSKKEAKGKSPLKK